MYANPVLLPQFTNREDFVLTVSVFDDDTGQPINLSGTTLASAAPFTGSSWSVIDGAISTFSNTTITIPTFPITNQLSALALTVAPSLGILPGDPITIADSTTGKNVMVGYVVSYSPSSGALVCQIGMTFQFEIRPVRRRGFLGDGFTTFGDIGVATTDGPILSAALGTGISIIDQGFLKIVIPEAQMRRLHNRTYLASLTMTDSVNTRQLFIGMLPEFYGGVTN